MQMSFQKPMILAAALASLSLLGGCFHHHRDYDDDRVVAPAGYHDRGEWHEHHDWDHDRDRHDWDRDRY